MGLAVGNYMVWQWLGHVLRMPDTALVKQVLTSLKSIEPGRRRYRAGPDNSGHRSALRYLEQQGIRHELALDRHAWQAEQTGWLLHHGLTGTSDAIAFMVPNDLYMWDRRCLQGSFHGQKVFVCLIGPGNCGVILELDRTLGWRALPGQMLHTPDALLSEVWNSNWIKFATFHIRMLLFSPHDEDIILIFICIVSWLKFLRCPINGTAE